MQETLLQFLMNSGSQSNQAMTVRPALEPEEVKNAPSNAINNAAAQYFRNDDNWRFEVGWGPTRGLYWPKLVFGVVFPVFGVHSHSCWPSTDRYWVLTALGGVSRPFSWLSQPRGDAH